MKALARFPVFLLFLSFFCASAFPQSDFKTTAGTELNAELAGQSEEAGRAVFIYHLRALGYSAGERLGFVVSNSVKAQPAADGRTVVGQVRAGLRMDEKGTVLGANGAPYQVGIRGPFPGETYYVTIISMGRKNVQSSTRITPVPLEARSGECSVEAILVAPAGAEYEIHGAGFPPGEEVAYTRKSGEEIKTGQTKVGKDGTWKMRLEPKRTGAVEGSMEVSFSGSSCNLQLTLPWKNPPSKK